MPAYVAKGEWTGVLEPDNEGEEEVFFRADDDLEARWQARRIAEERNFELTELRRFSGEQEISLE